MTSTFDNCSLYIHKNTYIYIYIYIAKTERKFNYILNWIPIVV